MGLTAAIGVGAGRAAAGFGTAGLAAFLTFLAFLGAARFLATRLAVRFGARRATARFFALDFFLAFLFFLAMSSSPEQVFSSSIRFRPTALNLHDRTGFAKPGSVRMRSGCDHPRNYLPEYANAARTTMNQSAADAPA